MTAKEKAPCSDVTLAECAGLADSILKKLKGKNGRKWLTWLKRFDRKKNPWVPSRRLESFQKSEQFPTLPQLLQELAVLDLSLYPHVEAWAERGNAARLPGLKEDAEVIEVRLGDLIPEKELVGCNYGDVASRARKEGFGFCDPRIGLSACVNLVRKVIGSGGVTGDSAREYLICTSAFTLPGTPRVVYLPNVWFWPYPKSEPGKHQQGGVALYALNRAPGSAAPTNAANNLFERPETRLLFVSEG